MAARTVLALCLILTGCGDSKNPLSDPTTSKADKRLLGVWKLVEDNGQVTNFHVVPAGEKFPAAMMRVAFVRHEKGQPESSGEFLIFPTALNGKTYLNVTDGMGKQGRSVEDKRGKAEAVRFYSFIKYEVDGNTLRVWWPLVEQAKQQTIKAGKVKGVTEFGTPSRFTDTTENVAHLVEQQHRLFPTEAIRLVMVGNGVRRTEPQVSQCGEQVEAMQSCFPPVATPTPPLRPLGSNLKVDKNGIIWDQGRPVGIWGVNGDRMYWNEGLQ
jgi:hypothetical protein